jgi:hypothetical protein
MQMINGKAASFVARGMLIGGLPLLIFMLLFLKLMAARDAGHSGGGDGIGLAMMSVLAFGIAVLSFTIGIGYFGYMLARHKLHPSPWHWAVLGYSSLELATPFIYFSLT